MYTKMEGLGGTWVGNSEVIDQGDKLGEVLRARVNWGSAGCKCYSVLLPSVGCTGGGQNENDKIPLFNLANSSLSLVRFVLELVGIAAYTLNVCDAKTYFLLLWERVW